MQTSMKKVRRDAWTTAHKAQRENKKQDMRKRPVPPQIAVGEEDDVMEEAGDVTMDVLPRRRSSRIERSRSGGRVESVRFVGTQ